MLKKDVKWQYTPTPETCYPVSFAGDARMKTFFEWFNKSAISPDRPWLMLGKGPSFSQRDAYDLSGFYLLSLNHAVREQRVKVAHIIDSDVVEDCGEAIERNAEVLVMPWRPHVRFVPGERNLSELTQVNPTLRRLREEGRLVWYNLSTTKERHGESPVIHADFFSAEAALNLLAEAGVRRVRSLGVDGGRSYNRAFDDLRDKTLLAGGQRSFDLQFKGFARTIMRTRVDFAPLDMEAPVRIFVGATEAQMIPTKVLEYSIRKHASMTTEVFPLHRARVEIPQPKDARNRPRTPFSFQRFLIPELAEHQGRAVYLDSDMLVFKDIRRLWMLPFEDAQLLTVKAQGFGRSKPQFSVMLMDCGALDWNIGEIVAQLDRHELSYEELMFEMVLARGVRASIDGSWNSLDRFHEGRTALLHYTDMTRQPWLVRHHPLNHLWMRELFEAIDGGYVSLTEIEEHARRGYIRPSLLYQAQERIPDSRSLPEAACTQDSSFTKQQGLSAGRTLALRERVRHVLKAVALRGL